MKIIIPMSGIGKRFLDAGYEIPKPLLRVDGKPIIEYVINLFPGEDDFVFICNKDHIETTDMKQILNKLKPSAKIIVIDRHKYGPVYAVAKASDEISDEEEVIVSYCDFNAVWNYPEFKKKAEELKFEGAIPSYIGFHPHLIHKKLYASLLINKDKFMEDIKEKHSFTPNPMDCHQSCGIYYFRKGWQLKKYFNELMELNINLKGEYYVSMVYYLYKRDNLKVYVPEIKKFMQWGIPEDLEEYELWSRYFADSEKYEKGPTDIPDSRLMNLRIEQNSEHYGKIFEYWQEYFSKTEHNPNE
ncbi:NTP transferase domain-containing protein [Candidatus Woesearchaeota archaeon]|nr:NTP transferase domain-containing protein [Candidatus Woesearchaeota archaeon]